MAKTSLYASLRLRPEFASIVMKRRDFLKLFAAFTASGGLGHVAAADNSRKRASDRVLLGPRQIPVSRMFVGTGTGGWDGDSSQSRELGVSGLAALLLHASDQGVTGWDTADQYGTHPHVREALKAVHREQITDRDPLGLAPLFGREFL
jgi:1-deoxyxylulose-5-phosphate synthase